MYFSQRSTGSSTCPSASMTLYARAMAVSSRLVLRGRVRVDHLSRLELVGEEDDLLARPPELIEARALDLLVLDHQRAALGPLAVLAELHLTDDRVELRGPDVIGDLLLIEALGRLD